MNWSNLISKLEEQQKQLNCFTYIVKEEELKQQIEYISKKYNIAEENLKPIIIKDNIAVKNLPLTCASKILENYKAVYNATVIERLYSAGYIPVAKANMDEFAMGGSGEFSYFGPTKNPINTEYVAGGSSSGSAAAILNGPVNISLGSDTGGSVRLPAAFCSVHSLKPTYGAVSRYGLVAFASSLDQIGPIAKNLDDLINLTKVIIAYDPKDATSIDENKIKEYESEKIEKVIIPKQLIENSNPTIASTIEDTAKKLFKEIKIMDIDFFKYLIPTYYIIAPAEASSNLARFDGVRYGNRIQGDNIFQLMQNTREQFGPEVKRRIVIGTFVLSVGYSDKFYKKALTARNFIKEEINKILKEFDAIIMPTAPVFPYKLGEKINDPLSMYILDQANVLANLTGLPAANYSIDIGKEFPVGFQILSRKYYDLAILNKLKELER